ncbi:sensor histidine kinase N-terminal domain-containing protein [Roseobacteraceae bacterium S113]
MKAQSLRVRLIVIILTPLLLVSAVAAVWQFRNTANRAEDIFDRGLLSAALAISRDVAVSGGDALSPPTRRLISDTSGGELFYHVYAPDGVFITGYATPPSPPTGTPTELKDPIHYDAVYLGREVRVLRFQDATTVDGVTGLFTISVWQDMQVRASFVRDVVSRAFSVIVLLLVSVALIVWFGVGLGLRPLLDLQNAIARRTPSDLNPIRRNVPVEAMGIVATLNDLLDRVSRRISSKDEFISNAAHQLRNPIAGVLALAEAVEKAPSTAAAKKRSSELVAAAREASHLTNQLLSFERAKGADLSADGKPIEIGPLCKTVLDRFKDQNTAALAGIDVSAHIPDETLTVLGDDFMLQEALLNLLTNALVHGGSDLGKIHVSAERHAATVKIRVADDGIGIAPKDRILAIGRFSQANAGPGTGLGLPIASRVIQNHGGQLVIAESTTGAKIEISLPIRESSNGLDEI